MNWEKCSLTKYVGSYEMVKESCPNGVEIPEWITALCIEILEAKMKDQKDLWELIAVKGKKYISKRVLNDNQKRRKLKQNAKEYIQKYNPQIV
jgi:hypothetical protein